MSSVVPKLFCQGSDWKLVYTAFSLESYLTYSILPWKMCELSYNARYEQVFSFSLYLHTDDSFSERKLKAVNTLSKFKLLIFSTNISNRVTCLYWKQLRRQQIISHSFSSSVEVLRIVFNSLDTHVFVVSQWASACQWEHWPLSMDALGETKEKTFSTEDHFHLKFKAELIYCVNTQSCFFYEVSDF